MNGKTFIIAEAGVNHNGSLDLAHELVNVARDVGADAVKFQTFKAANLVRESAPKAEYQKRTTAAEETQREMLRNLELSEEAHISLLQHCRQDGIQFLSTPFDGASVRFLHDTLDLPLMKTASGEITNAPLLLEIARTGKPVVVSTGMSTLGDVESALGVLAFGYRDRNGRPSFAAFREAFCSLEGQSMLHQKVTLLHCTTEYPAPVEDVNLRALATLRSAFGLSVGFSDHTSGITIPIAAVALGACMIEKHLTLDRNMPGPDHRASLEPGEFREMVASIRAVEAALGSPAKIPSAAEAKNITVARKSIVASKEIREGEVFSVENLTVKRPAGGMSPMLYWDLVGCTAQRDISRDEQVN